MVEVNRASQKYRKWEMRSGSGRKLTRRA